MNKSTGDTEESIEEVNNNNNNNNKRPLNVSLLSLNLSNFFL